jgi:hypothetical protein
MLPMLEREAAERQKASQKQGGETAGSGRPKGNSSPQFVGESYSNDEPEPPRATQTKKPKSHEGEAVAQAAKAAKYLPTTTSPSSAARSRSCVAP